MSGKKPTKTVAEARAERLAEALKANLRRRKAQARGRRETNDDGEAGAPDIARRPPGD